MEHEAPHREDQEEQVLISHIGMERMPISKILLSKKLCINLSYRYGTLKRNMRQFWLMSINLSYRYGTFAAAFVVFFVLVSISHIGVEQKIIVKEVVLQYEYQSLI